MFKIHLLILMKILIGWKRLIFKLIFMISMNSLNGFLIIYQTIQMQQEPQLLIGKSQKTEERTDEKSQYKDKDKVEDNSPRIFFQLQEKVGTFGKYQIMTIILWCSIMFLNGGLMFMTPFLFYQAPYDCKDEFAQSICTDKICGLQEPLRQKYVPDKFINSIANHFGDYRCPSDKLGFDSLIAVMFFGVAVGFLCLTLFGELIGRKRLLQINLASFVLGLAILVPSVNLYMAGVGLFFSTLGINNAFIICFYFIVQTVADDKRQKMSVVCQIFYGVGVIMDIFWYWLIRDWQLVLGICFLIPAVAILIILSIFVKDTPSCLVLRNSSEKALEDFLQIAKMNGIETTLQEEEIIDAREHYEFSIQKSNMSKFTVIDLFKYKSTRFISILLIILFCTICFSFYAPSLMLDEFEFDIFINGLAVGVSQIIAYGTSFLIVKSLKRKILAYICFALTGICSIILIFTWKQRGEEGSSSTAEQIGVLVLIFLFQLSISIQFTIFYVYQNQLYPTQARVIGTSVVSLVGEGVVIFASEIIDLCLSSGFPVMIIFAILSGLCIFISFLLPETFQKVPEELILEFREKSSKYKSKLSGYIGS